jgi:DeoR family transcriptional regulator of aga operon
MLYHLRTWGSQHYPAGWNGAFAVEGETEMARRSTEPSARSGSPATRSGSSATEGDGARLPVDRRLYILDRIAAQGSVRMQALAEELGTSVMTVRRDIKRLEEDGFLRRSYGGATAHVMLDMELGANGLALQHMAEKRAIAQRAAALLEPRDVLFLGTGTTVAQFARQIPTGRGITVVTYSLTIASMLGVKSGVTVISTGGRVDPEDLAQVGPLAEATVSRYFATKTFIGAGGLHPGMGVTDYSAGQADLNRLMVERAERAYVLADNSKLGRRTFAQVCTLSSLAALVTDDGAEEPALAELAAEGLAIFTPTRTLAAARSA